MSMPALQVRYNYCISDSVDACQAIFPLYSIVMSIPTTLHPTTAMSTTEQTTPVTWTMATTTPSDILLTTPSDGMATITPSDILLTTPSDGMAITTLDPSYSEMITPNETMATTTNPPDLDDGTTTTVNSITINQTDAISEANSIASKTVGMITVDQSMATAPIEPIVGAIVGIFLLLILGVTIAVVVLYQVRRRNTGGNYSTGKRAGKKKAVVECKPYYVCTHDITEQQQSLENQVSKLDMEQNVAYESCMHDITEQQQSVENWESKLDMEQNVAYESLNTAQISLGTNVAYYESGRQYIMHNE